MCLRGKPKMVAIGALMRKLVHWCYGVLKTGTVFNDESLKQVLSTWLYQAGIKHKVTLTAISERSPLWARSGPSNPHSFNWLTLVVSYAIVNMKPIENSLSHFLQIRSGKKDRFWLMTSWVVHLYKETSPSGRVLNLRCIHRYCSGARRISRSIILFI